MNMTLSHFHDYTCEDIFGSQSRVRILKILTTHRKLNIRKIIEGKRIEILGRSGIADIIADLKTPR